MNEAANRRKITKEHQKQEDQRHLLGIRLAKRRREIIGFFFSLCARHGVQKRLCRAHIEPPHYRLIDRPSLIDLSFYVMYGAETHVSNLVL
mgnify:FL=1